mgnify:CR=1 FL=1
MLVSLMVKKTFSIGKATPTIVWASDEVTLTYTGQPAAVALVLDVILRCGRRRGRGLIRRVDVQY